VNAVSKSKLSILASPLLCLGLLGGIVAEDSTHLQPSDVGPYHRAAKEAVEAWPREIADGRWFTQEDRSLPPAAEQLLHPNVEIDRLYTSRDLWINGQPASASLLVVQCRDTRDMAGHYPPICYPASGEQLESSEPFQLTASGVTISGMEYHFVRKSIPVFRRCVYDFFIVPGKGFQSDMTQVRQAAADYQRRYYGAAQFQVVMSDDYSQEQRERIFKTIIGANPRAFTVLNTVEIP
jgi:hypothetical protein